MRNYFIHALLFISIFMSISCKPSKQYHFLVGTYTESTKSEGIYSYSINIDDECFEAIYIEKDIENPSFLSFSEDKKKLYAVSELGINSSVFSFFFDTKTGKLERINSIPLPGSDPCYVASSGKHVITANYSSGSISVVEQDESDGLHNIVQEIKHSGSSIDSTRQTKPHVHQALFSPDMRFVFTNDLGTDFVTSYFYHPDSEIVLQACDSIKLKAGSGPRHLVFNTKGDRAYVLQEMDGTLSVLSVNEGKMQLLQETSIALNQDSENGAADIYLSPDNRFLYASNRGQENTITCFSVSEDGRLNFVEQISTEGIGPRNFALSPDGKYVFVANQKSDEIVIFKRDKESGKLSDTTKRIKVYSPVCIAFY